MPVVAPRVAADLLCSMQPRSTWRRHTVAPRGHAQTPTEKRAYKPAWQHATACVTPGKQHCLGAGAAALGRRPHSLVTPSRAAAIRRQPRTNHAARHRAPSSNVPGSSLRKNALEGPAAHEGTDQSKGTDQKAQGCCIPPGRCHSRVLDLLRLAPRRRHTLCQPRPPRTAALELCGVQGRAITHRRRRRRGGSRGAS
jgi:hypothetical protein